MPFCQAKLIISEKAFSAGLKKESGVLLGWWQISLGIRYNAFYFSHKFLFSSLQWAMSLVGGLFFFEGGANSNPLRPSPTIVSLKCMYFFSLGHLMKRYQESFFDSVFQPSLYCRI